MATTLTTLMLLLLLHKFFWLRSYQSTGRTRPNTYSVTTWLCCIDHKSGQYMLISLRHPQVKAGVSFDLLQQPCTKLSYLTNCWMVSLQQFCANFEISIRCKQNRLPSLARVHDSCHMDKALQLFLHQTRAHRCLSCLHMPPGDNAERYRFGRWKGRSHTQLERAPYSWSTQYNAVCPSALTYCLPKRSLARMPALELPSSWHKNLSLTSITTSWSLGHRIQYEMGRHDMGGHP